MSSTQIVRFGKEHLSEADGSKYCPHSNREKILHELTRARVIDGGGCSPKIASSHKISL
jgi:hypothetical protein